MSVNIGYEWTEIEWWQDSTNDPDQKVRWRVRAWCEEDIEDNSSDVYFKVQKRITNGDKGWAEYPSTKTMRITGTGASSDSHSATMTWTFGRTTSTAWADASGDYSDAYWSNVKHNADGTLTIRAYITGDRVVSGSIDTYVDLVLPTIPRASVPSPSKTAMTLDGSDSIVISTNRKSTSFTHSLTFTVGSHSVTVNNVGASYTWTPGVDYWMPYMTSKEMTVTVTCKTYSGSTQIGSAKTCTFKLNVDETVYAPVIDSVSHSDTNAITAALEASGTYIRYKSTFALTVGVSVKTAAYGSALSSAKVIVNGVTRNYTLSVTIQTISFTKTEMPVNSVRIEVTDNRGVTVSRTLTLTMINYSPLSIGGIEAWRVNTNDEPSETGDKIHYKITCGVFWGSFGQANNSIVVDSKYKLSSAADYSSYTTEQPVATSGTGEFKTVEIEGVCVGSYSATSQFDLIFRLTDSLAPANAPTIAIKVNEGVPVFAWGADHFDVYGDFHIHDRTDITKYLSFNLDSVEVVPVTFSGAAGGSVNWTVFKFGKLRIATCRWRAVNNYTCNSAWGSLYYTPNISTPNFPVAFDLVTYQNIRYVGADNGATYTAFAELNILVADSAGNTTKTNMGSLCLYRPDSGATIGHPVFTQIVIGTV